MVKIVSTPKETVSELLRFLAEQKAGLDSPVIPPDFAQVVAMITAALAVPAKDRG